jgi:hypothetical protein
LTTCTETEGFGENSAGIFGKENILQSEILTYNMPDLQWLSKSFIFIKLPPNPTAVIQPLDAGNLISS